MKLYCNLKLKGINSEDDFKNYFRGFNSVLNLDDIHFMIPDINGNINEKISVHLDFDEVCNYFTNGEVVVTLKTLADTWNELNLENNIKKENITTELLEKGYVENYVLSFTKDDGKQFTDIKMIRIGYVDENEEEKYFKINDLATNEL